MDAPVLSHVTGLTLMPDTPAGVVCWHGRMRGAPGVPVNVLLHDQPAAALDAGFIDEICAGAERHLAVAARAAELDGDPDRWDPEVTFRAGHEWEVRFTEAPGPTELGLLVVFEGEQVTEIDDLAEWEDA